MALTRDQLVQNINAMEKQGAPPADIQSYINSQGSSSAPTKKPSVLKEFGKSLLNAPAKIAATAAQAGTTAAALAGSKEANLASQRFAKEGVNLPIVGKVKPIGSPLEAAGVGLETASLIPAIRAPAVGAQLLKGTIGKGALRGGIEGGTSGALMGAGSGIQDPNATPDSVTASALKGGALGTIGGSAIGSVLPAIPAAVARRANKKEEEVTNAIRQVLQGETKDIETGRKVLSSLDPSSIKTYGDMRKQVGDRIKTISDKHDEVLETNTTQKKLPELNLTTTVGGQSLKQNYVQQALDQLTDFYAKTNNAEGRLIVDNLKKKASQEGLTVKEINNIAKMHGNELSAFNASGELASGLTKQAAENTRAGVKATVRDLFGNNLSKAADAEVTKLIRVRDLADDMVEKVNTLRGNIQERSLGNKVGRLAAQAMDILTGGALKSFGRTLLIERGAGSNTLNSLDLERMLSKNIRLIQKASKEGAEEETIIKALEDFITANGSKVESIPKKPDVLQERYLTPDEMPTIPFGNRPKDLSKLPVIKY